MWQTSGGAGSVLLPDLSGVIWGLSLQVFVELHIQVVCISVCIGYYQHCAGACWPWSCQCVSESWLCHLFPAPQSVTGRQLESSPGGNAYTTVIAHHHKPGLSLFLESWLNSTPLVEYNNPFFKKLAYFGDVFLQGWIHSTISKQTAFRKKILTRTLQWKKQLDEEKGLGELWNVWGS